MKIPIPDRINKRLEDFFLQKRLLKGHKSYNRFIILGCGRTGSNLLATSLRNHSQIVCYGELFNNANHDRLGWGRADYIPFYQQKGLISLREHSPIEFLDSSVFRRFRREVGAVGFKLFYYHAREPSWQSVWNYLKEIPELRVLHIQRNNILRTLVSMKIASITKQWSTPVGGPLPSVPALKLDFDECFEAFQQTRSWEKEYQEFFSDHQQLVVIYEDLVKDFGPHMTRIQQFLGVEAEQLRPSIQKQNTKPLSLAVSNYQELKERFKGTEWADFFDE